MYPVQITEVKSGPDTRFLDEWAITNQAKLKSTKNKVGGKFSHVYFFFSQKMKSGIFSSGNNHMIIFGRIRKSGFKNFGGKV